MTFAELRDKNLAWSDTTLIRVYDLEAKKPDFTPLSVRSAMTIYYDFQVSFFTGDLVVGMFV